MRRMMGLWVMLAALACDDVERGQRPAPGTAKQPQAGDAEAVAYVNGSAITRLELERMRANPFTLAELNQQHGGAIHDEELVDRIALRKLVERRLLVEEAARRGLSVPEEEVDASVLAVRRRFPDLESFGAWIKQQGSDEQTFVATLRQDLLVERTRAALASEVDVSEPALRSYYERHLAELRAPGAVRLRIIAVDDPAAAETVVDALKRGVPFEQLARTLSLGVRAAEGGDTGFVDPSRLAPPLREVALALQPGQTYGPLRRGDDYLVVRFEERRTPRTPSLDEVRAHIERALRSEGVRDWLTARETSAAVSFVNGS